MTEELPDGMAAFDFDPEGMTESHPGWQGNVEVFLEALCHHNPGTPRKLCATIGAQLLAQLGVATAGNEAGFMDAVAWMQAQGEGMTIIDPTGMLQRMVEGEGGEPPQ